MEGWIKLHRKIADWQWASSPNHMSLFMQLLLRANHKQTKWRFETISPGQLLTGRKQLMDWTGLTERQVRKCLDDLETTKEIVRKRATKYSIITIANWETYQSDDRQTSNKRPANVQQTSTSNNVNNNNNEINNNLLLAPEKNLPEKDSQEILKTTSPLSALFTHMPEVQAWLDQGFHDTHKLLLGKYSKQTLEIEVLDMYVWASRNDVKAESWMYKRLLSKNLSSKGSNKAQKSFSRKGHGVESSPENPTGDPYLQQALDEGLVS
jgi:hypothetical protein